MLSVKYSRRFFLQGATVSLFIKRCFRDMYPLFYTRHSMGLRDRYIHHAHPVLDLYLPRHFSYLVRFFPKRLIAANYCAGDFDRLELFASAPVIFGPDSRNRRTERALFRLSPRIYLRVPQESCTDATNS